MRMIRKMEMEAKALPRIARRILSSEKVAAKYQDFGHGEGSIIWWVDNQGKLQIYVSTGSETHHELNKRMDMDARWRGRIESDTRRVTMIPPLRLYQKEIGEIHLPDVLMSQLEKLGGKIFYLDTAKGMSRIGRTKVEIRTV